jgi:SAM-dependent methyltransferase
MVGVDPIGTDGIPVATGWDDPVQAMGYLARSAALPPRTAGEKVLIDGLPSRPRSLLDLGGGDGRLAASVLGARPTVSRAVVVDRSPPMLELAAGRFRDDPRVEVRR